MEVEDMATNPVVPLWSLWRGGRRRVSSVNAWNHHKQHKYSTTTLPHTLFCSVIIVEACVSAAFSNPPSSSFFSTSALNTCARPVPPTRGTDTCAIAIMCPCEVNTYVSVSTHPQLLIPRSYRHFPGPHLVVVKANQAKLLPHCRVGYCLCGVQSMVKDHVARARLIERGGHIRGSSQHDP